MAVTVDARAGTPEPAADAAAAAASEWPPALLLDELWLRSRRVLVHRLEEVGLWLPRAEHAAFRQRSRQRGEALRAELLPAVVGPDDRHLLAALSGEVLFGASNASFRGRLPYVLDFGHALGRGFGALAGSGGERLEEAARLAALFNFGISIFDLLHDDHPSIREEFSELFDGALLRRLGESPQAGRELAAVAAAAASPEVRLLAGTIVAFFAGVGRLAGEGTAGGRLAALLAAAYGAEMRSLERSSELAEEALATARGKSALPFEVLREIARLAGGEDAAAAPRVDGAARLAGAIFFHLDDLVDVVPDFRAGALNAVLLRAGGSPSLAAAGGVPWEEVLARALDGGTVEGVVAELIADLEALQQELGRLPSAAAGPFFRDLLGYLRNWLM